MERRVIHVDELERLAANVAVPFDDLPQEHRLHRELERIAGLSMRVLEVNELQPQSPCASPRQTNAWATPLPASTATAMRPMRLHPRHGFVRFCSDGPASSAPASPRIAL
jgi:hypothetical protein